MFDAILAVSGIEAVALIWNQRHLQHVLTRYIEHYNAGRRHRGIDLEIPVCAPATATAHSQRSRAR